MNMETNINDYAKRKVSAGIWEVVYIPTMEVIGEVFVIVDGLNRPLGKFGYKVKSTGYCTFRAGRDLNKAAQACAKKSAQ